MTTLSNILVPSNILTASNTCTVTNKTISGANNTLTVRMANDVSGTLPVANGGTGQTTYTNGQLLIGNTTGNTLSKNTLTAGTDIVITNGNGSISIEYVPPDVSVAYAWGGGGSGRLGNNDTADKNSPVSVVGGYTDWCQVSAGTRNSLAVRTNGTAWAWGYNTCGSLGDNTTVSKSSPVQVVGGFTDWCQISAGGFFGNAERHSVAVRTNGTAWSWGSGTAGVLGTNNTTDRSSPVSVVGGYTDWCQVSGGNQFSLGVRTNGTAWAWGYNGTGRLGDGTTTNRSTPVSVVGGFTDWCQVDAGDSQSGHSVGVRQNGTAWAWGSGSNGKLGDNTTTDRSSPVSVVGGITDWCQVSGGNQFSVGVRQNGTAWAWGYNCRGQLGDNTAGENCSRLSPVQVVGGFTDWCQASAGVGFISAVRTNGTAWSWGQHNGGNLGDASGSGKCSPVSVVGGFTNWCQVSAGYFHTLGITLTVV